MNYHLNKVNSKRFDFFRQMNAYGLNICCYLGDVFTKIEDEDDQGWCKGRVGDRVGLYPATYVENL